MGYAYVCVIYTHLVYGSELDVSQNQLNFLTVYNICGKMTDYKNNYSTAMLSLVRFACNCFNEWSFDQQRGLIILDRPQQLSGFKM